MKNILLRLLLIQKWKRLGQPRQANVHKRKKGGFPFILLGLCDPEGLGAGTRRIKSGSALVSPDRQKFTREKKAVFLLFSWGYVTPRG
ncbi:hypothetical protein FZC78_21030 [Rossellomorea vietnamensis]|uniref:Uncharacterized protein n=1 Tax=Rossellomorea vietnamensis TaxID=218284 RepID=A0A5D4NIK8_9BACI|nr:hypothetical protein [Rossellomorea vietnamensis]TYS13649.1 hypothetical protein FZC78_21030 [Rossellomorea vietnamensis]